jgi:hypothetical protein
MNKYLSITLIALFSAAIASSCTGKEFGGNGSGVLQQPGQYDVDIKGRIKVDWTHAYYLDINADGKPDLEPGSKTHDTLWVYMCTAYDVYHQSFKFVATKETADGIKTFANDQSITTISLSVYEFYVAFGHYEEFREGGVVVGGELSGEVTNVVATGYQRQ